MKVNNNKTNYDRIFYMHVAKTAGSSLNRVIASKFAKSEISLHIENHSARHQKGALDHYMYLSGHISIVAARKKMGLGHRYQITMFRDPIEQLASHLRWVKLIESGIGLRVFSKHPKEVRQISRELQKINFRDADSLLHYLNGLSGLAYKYFNNCQTRYLLGPKATLIGDFEFEQAMKAFDFFHLIGITERFSPFVNALSKKMGWSLPSTQSMENVNTSDFGLDTGIPEIREVLQSSLTYDLKLYERASAVAP